MTKLELCKSPFIRVRKGQTKQEIGKMYGVFVEKAVWEGCLIVNNASEFFAYEVQPNDTYQSLAQKFLVDAERLKEVNDNCFLYPTAVVLIPKKNLQNAEGG
jgi:spore germination protein YaaH